jgi:hypothetical protein
MLYLFNYKTCIEINHLSNKSIFKFFLYEITFFFMFSFYTTLKIKILKRVSFFVKILILRNINKNECLFSLILNLLEMYRYIGKFLIILIQPKLN